MEVSPGQNAFLILAIKGASIGWHMTKSGDLTIQNTCRNQAALNVESGLNDGDAIPFFLFFPDVGK